MEAGCPASDPGQKLNRTIRLCVRSSATPLTSKFQPRILVIASRTARQLSSDSGRIKLITSNTVKRRPAPLALKGAVITPIVPKPEKQEDDGYKQAVDDGGYREVEHRNV
jgi:hypothetical protein